jgi:hypothetical protein
VKNIRSPEQSKNENRSSPEILINKKDQTTSNCRRKIIRVATQDRVGCIEFNYEYKLTCNWLSKSWRQSEGEEDSSRRYPSHLKSSPNFRSAGQTELLPIRTFFFSFPNLESNIVRVYHVISPKFQTGASALNESTG